MLRFQQLAEWKGENGAEGKCLCMRVIVNSTELLKLTDVMNFKFVNHLCKEELYKPKAPY